ncbi:MAG: Gfo/Idh/MocA family oxidoreductase [Oscillospiraceae bacterium]|nr:Gfo/Idh/MocA family oxidoreductase [Oscillospiraceae bacterium]
MVKIAIIGIGNMGTIHAQRIFGGVIDGLELACICDISPKRLDWAREEFGDKVKLFKSSDELFENADLFDAVIIATPHYDHPSLAIKAFELGKHVLVEKPAGVYTKAVREMNAAAEKSGKKFCIMYNQRTIPAHQKIREMVQSGELGTIKRMIWIATSWYRPQSYHDSSTWRSTWVGEGGGVLLNQCPHQLDLWWWIFGMPKRVRGFASFGKYYNIEVDDDVTAYAEYNNGMTATFITATGEFPGTNRLEISGSLGKLVMEDNNLRFWRNEVDEREFNAGYKGGFGNPEVSEREIPLSGEASEHIGILQNFANAILNGEELLSPGIEGIYGLTISNAIHLSAWTDNWVEFPMDEDLFYDTLQAKIKNSTFEKVENDGNVLDLTGTH